MDFSKIGKLLTYVEYAAYVVALFSFFGFGVAADKGLFLAVLSLGLSKTFSGLVGK